MDKYFRNRAKRLFLVDCIAIALMLMAMPLMAATDAVSPTEISFSQARFANGGAGSNKMPETGQLASFKSRNVVAGTIGSPFWIYDAQVELFFDDDRDGHFYGLDVRFDADTDYFGAEVYARLYLSLEGGPWVHYYTTEYFSIFGTSGDDDYLVETELFDGYPTGYYDVLIDLYDESGFLVATFGPQNSSELSVLPLEDQQKDTPFVPPPAGSSSVSRGGGGAIGILGLLPLALLMLARRKS